jgi:hypothetical protein
MLSLPWKRRKAIKCFSIFMGVPSKNLEGDQIRGGHIARGSLVTKVKGLVLTERRYGTTGNDMGSIRILSSGVRRSWSITVFWPVFRDAHGINDLFLSSPGW